MIRGSTFRYFAYGSNLWPPRMRGRCPSATLLGTAVLEGWRATYDKPGADGSAKLNIRPQPGASVAGVVYLVERSERPRLDAAERGYRAVATAHGLAYVYAGEPAATAPAEWYVAIVETGAALHGLPAPPRPGTGLARPGAGLPRRSP